jgi:predicted TIM-barrel fold metal-dependent hydrolase
MLRDKIAVMSREKEDSSFKDVHVHLWPVRYTPKDLSIYFEKRGIADRLARTVSAEGIIEIMEVNNIATSAVSAIAYTGLTGDDLEAMNDYTHQEVKKSSGRLIGLCVVDPLGGPATLDRVRKWIEEKGFKGVKVHPSFQQCHPNAPELYPLYDLLQEYRLPVLFHSGPIGIAPAKDKYSTTIENFDEVACDFPSLPMILGHGGRPQYAQAANLLRKHKNVHIDISANFARLKDFESSPLQELLYQVKTLAGSFQRVLFGSDYPVYFQEETCRALNAATVALNHRFKGFVREEDTRLIARQNFDELFAMGEHSR